MPSDPQKVIARFAYAAGLEEADARSVIATVRGALDDEED